MSSNPLMKQEVYQNVYVDGAPMTIAGTMNKTMLLLGLTVLTACYTWYLAINGFADKLNMITITGLIGGLICAIAAAFRPQNSKILSIGYAAFEGLVLGGISAIFNAMYPGIVVQAVLITFCCMFVMLALFKAGIIRATARFKGVIIGATFAIMAFYGIAILMSFFKNMFLMNLIYSSSTIGLVFSVVIAIIACLNFILDFDFIEQGARMNAPKYMEWYGALSLLVTLIWLYIEILRLLAKLSDRRS